MNDISSSKGGFFSGGRWLFLLLCLILFLSAITTGDNVFRNAWLIFWYEALFVVGFLISRAKEGVSGNLFRVKSVGFWLLVAWFSSVTLSLINSPFGLMEEWFAVQRYFQSLFHMLFFLCAWSFLISYRGSLSPLFFSLSASVAVLAPGFIGSWFALDVPLESDSKQWFRHPPFNAHIRITGFLVAAASAGIAPYLAEKAKTKVGQFGLYFCGLAIWGLMFWSGGRGSILSALIVYMAVAVLLKIKGRPLSRFLITTMLLIVGGIVLAEIFKVFYWNGVFQATSRTVEAGGDVYKLATGRPKLWGLVVKTLGDTGAWVFGLGSQGYSYIPTRYGFQPHNLFFQFLAEWGVVGTVLFLSMLVYGFFRGFMNHIVRGPFFVPMVAAGAIIVSLGLHSLVDGIFYHAQSSFYMALAFAVWMVPQKS